MPDDVSINAFPFRCGLGAGCPKLFSDAGGNKGRRYCVFQKSSLFGVSIRNPKCPASMISVKKSLVIRIGDDDC
jgi:hypothetical protein